MMGIGASIAKTKRPRDEDVDDADEGHGRKKQARTEPEVSNIGGLVPFVGMKLDIRDSDYIWSSGRLVDIVKDGSETMVTVRFDGWGAEWDEKITWPSERLARLYTYTKEVKCFLDLLRKKKSKPTQKQLELAALPSHARKDFATVWPCRVQYRMPHPVLPGASDEESCLDAEGLLRLEKNLYFKPYAPNLLPANAWSDAMNDEGGLWLHRRHLRLWKDDPTELGILPENFMEAFTIGNDDVQVKGFAQPDSLETGSLLKPGFRIRDRRGAVVLDGCLVKSAEMPVQTLPGNPNTEGEEDGEKDRKPPTVVEIQRPERRSQDSSATADEAPTFVPRPQLPPPILITDPVYRGAGVKRCRLSNAFSASVNMGGNEVFLGNFKTQTEAYEAARLTKGGHVTLANSSQAAVAADLHAVPMAAIIDATEKHWNADAHDFSLHDWTMRMASHHLYNNKYKLWRERQAVETNTKVTATPEEVQASKVEPAPKPGLRKRKGLPKKVDLEKSVYLD